MRARELRHLRAVRHAACRDRDQQPPGAERGARDLGERIRGRAFDDDVDEGGELRQRHDARPRLQRRGVRLRAREVAGADRDEARLGYRARAEAAREVLADIAEAGEADAQLAHGPEAHGARRPAREPRRAGGLAFARSAAA